MSYFQMTCRCITVAAVAGLVIALGFDSRQLVPMNSGSIMCFDVPKEETSVLLREADKEN